MRLHPAVATALVLVGGALLVLPLRAWLVPATARSTISETPFTLLAVSLLSGTLGLVFILGAVMFSSESRPGVSP